MKNHILLLLTSFLLSQFCTGQALDFSWSKGFGGSAEEYGWTVITDKDGNIYCGGSFSSTSVTFGTITLTNSAMPTSDAFLVKYNSGGTVIWAKKYGSTGSDELRELAVDDSGNVYIAGYFQSSTINFDAITINGIGADDIFLARIDANGNADWAKAVADINDNRPDGLLIDPSGRVVLTGGFTNANLTIGSTTLTNAGDFDFFIARFNKSSGAVIDATSFGSSGRDEATSLNCSPTTGNYYLAGRFNSNSLTMGSNTLTNASGSNYDVLVACMSPTLGVVWAKRYGGTSEDEVNASVYTDNGGADALFIVGSFSSSSMPMGNDTLHSGGMMDVFAARIDGQTATWAVSTGDADEDMGVGIAVDDDNDVFITGAFGSGSLYFDSDTLINAGTGASLDVFVAAYDESGNNIYAASAGETGNDISFDIHCTGNNQAIITGWFEMPSITFGTNAVINCNGAQDGFLAYLESSTPIGISNASNDREISFYPNPANDVLYVNTSESQNGVIRIFDINGKLVSSEQINSAQTVLTLGDLPEGIYLVSILSGNSIHSGKLVLQR